MKRFFLFGFFVFVMGGSSILLTGFAADDSASPPLKICMLSGSLEYESDKSLPLLIDYLQEHYSVDCTLLKRKAKDDLPGLNALDSCDVMLLFTRRMTIDGEQLKKVKEYCLSGNPIVGIRTASHAFQNWLELDKLILGGNYQGHYGSGPVMEMRINKAAQHHPILKGIEPFTSVGSLYKNTPPASDVCILLTGSIPEHNEPIAWTRVFNGGRIFYTSLGHQEDFKNENFLRLVSNALYWVSGREPAKSSSDSGH